MGIFDELGKFGLGDLSESNLFENEKKEEEEKEQAKVISPEELEAEMLLDKKFKCPQCDKDFTSKIIPGATCK